MINGGKWGKVAIGMRLGRHGCDPYFFKSILALLGNGLRDGDVCMDPVAECAHAVAANITVANFMTCTTADTLCFIDDDMVFDQNILSVMRDEPEGESFDLMQSVCVTRSPPHYALAWLDTATPIPKKSSGVLEMPRCGLGLTFIRRNVFEVIKMERPNKPFFCFPEDGRGEDIYFSESAIQLGFRCGINMGANVSHRFPICARWDVEQGQVVFVSGNNAIVAKEK